MLVFTVVSLVALREMDSFLVSCTREGKHFFLTQAFYNAASVVRDPEN